MTYIEQTVSEFEEILEQNKNTDSEDVWTDHEKIEWLYSALTKQAKLYRGCVRETENKCVYEDGVRRQPEWSEVEGFRDEALNRMEKI